MNINDVKTIAVLGAGDMGHGIAQVALMAGYKVNLRDIKEEYAQKGADKIFTSLEKFLSKGKMTEEQVNYIKEELLGTYVSLEDAVKDADIIIEAIPEILDLKISTLKDIDKFAKKDACIATNTSTMSITKMSKVTNRSDKVFGLHFFNPVVLMKLVEIIKTDDTSDETVEMAKALVDKFGKIGVVAHKDTPGFIANRIIASTTGYLSAMLDVEKLDPNDIDASYRILGAPMGPCELNDYTGLDVAVHSTEYFVENLSPDYEAPKMFKDLVKEGHYGKKTGSGFYDWSNGRPEIDMSKYTGKYDPKEVTIIKANEACKLVDQGVCSLEDIDTAMKYGYSEMKGPIELIQSYKPEELTEILNELADKYDREIFRPSKAISEGKYIYKQIRV